MNLLNLTKFRNVIPPTAIKDNTAFVSTVLDKQTDIPTDCKGVLFSVALGATDIAMAVLRVQQSDTLSTATALGGTPTTVVDAATKPSADNDNGIALIYVPISAWTEQYLQLQATAGNGDAGTFMSAIAIFDHPGVSEATAASLGAITLDVA